jgi:tetratricopeptide (TPR) repeat protein
VAFASAVVLLLGILGAANRGSDPDQVVAKAKAEVNRGRPEKAEALIDDIVHRDRANPTAFYVRGVARLRQKDYVGAAGDFEKSYEQGGDPRALECLTYCYGEAGAYSMSIYRANQAEAAGHVTPTLLTNRAYATLVTAPLDFDRREAAVRSARVDLDKAKKLNSAHQGAHFITAFLIVRRCLESRKFDEIAAALEELDRAIAIGPPAPDLFYYAALVRAHDPKKTPQTEVEIVNFIGQALAHGGDPAKFTIEPPFRFLRNNPAFQAAVKQPPGPKPDHDLYWSNPVAGALE